MFTGIVEHLGAVVAVAGDDSGSRLTIDLGPLDGMAIGDSISVSGVCLTAVDVEGSQVSVEVVPETLSRTSLGSLVQGSSVNLERAMAADGRFDGHIVQGHVDGVGTVTGVADEGDGKRMSIQSPTPLLRYIVEKGSITADGVSLTVAGLEGDTFEIALIPHTLEVTTLGLRKAGDRVNLEVDVLAKYVERLLKADP